MVCGVTGSVMSGAQNSHLVKTQGGGIHKGQHVGEPPSTLGPYRLLNAIGVGGMATVYLAEDTRDSRRVALKVLTCLAGGDPVERFRQEALIGKRLEHPDIATVYESGVDHDFPWIAMEYLDGFELQKVMNDKSFGFEDRLNVIIRVATALHHAHTRSVIHRDIKPSNIFMTKEGGVRVLDFGIARLDEIRLTRVGLLLGTPHYMAPEQVQGLRVDARTDVFSMGVLCFELVTGELPWRADSVPQLMMSICSQPPVPFRTLLEPGPVLPDFSSIVSLHQIIHRAIAQEPEHRYQTAQAFSDALSCFLEGDTKAPAADISRRTVELAVTAPLRRIEWARARAARLEFEVPSKGHERVEPVSRGGRDSAQRVWLGLVFGFVSVLLLLLWFVASMGLEGGG